MPLYDYKCTACGRTTEVRHGFDHKHADPCPYCGGVLARVFNPAPIVFKGSGFYINDSRPSSSSASPSASTDNKTDAGAEAKADSKTEKSTETKTEAAPATTPAKTASASDSAA